MIAKAAGAYLKSESGSDIRALLRPILLDALVDPARCQPIVKRPLDMMVSALRCLGADTDGGDGVLRHLATMGQPLYQWATPDGYPEKTSAWTATLLPRWNFAIALATNGINGTKVDLQAPIKAAGAKSDMAIVDALMETVLGRPHTTHELAALRHQILDHVQRGGVAGVKENGLLAEATALLLSSPAFQWKA